MPHNTLEKQREYMRKYREKNRNKLRVEAREYHRKWRAENREKDREYNRRSRARRKEKIAATTRINRQVKRALLGHIKMLNGCCVCGFNKHPVALDFHHRDSSKKDFVVSRMVTGATYSLTKVLSEVSKCSVICANCHRILHSDECNASSVPEAE